MALTVPSLTFSRTEKGEEYLPKDQVTLLITEMQRMHKEAITAAVAAPHGEISKLEVALKDAQKGGARAADLDRELTELRGQVERRDTAAELLGLTDPGEIGDLHGLYQSRTASIEAAQRPPFRAWVEAGLKDPSQAPAIARSMFEAAAHRAAPPSDGPAGGGTPVQQQAAQGRQWGTGAGKVQGSAGAGPLTAERAQVAFAQGASARDLIRQYKIDRGIPVPPVDSGGEKM